MTKRPPFSTTIVEVTLAAGIWGRTKAKAQEPDDKDVTKTPEPCATTAPQDISSLSHEGIGHHPGLRAVDAVPDAHVQSSAGTSAQCWTQQGDCSDSQPHLRK